MQPFIIIFSLISLSLYSQQSPSFIFGLHQQYLETSITSKKFKHRVLDSLIQQVAKDPLFEVKTAGQSFLGKNIYLIRAGTGSRRVLLWSQMHGDESTATMALMDLFNYLQDESQVGRKLLLEHCTLYFIPMLNPDGADLFVRRNAQQIDVNRDALFLQSPEGRLLKSIRDSLNPEFGFNLHDQNKYLAAGDSKRPASISLLAPAYNPEKDINPVRERAMLLAAQIHLTLQAFIPQGIGRYDDEFEPRAFGDNIQKWGTSTVLIETGGYENDPEKQYLRKINFTAILSALESIATNSFHHQNIRDYWSIPENKSRLNDLIIRNVRLELNGKEYLSDLSFNIPESSGRATLVDMGDLSIFRGYREWDGTGKKLVPGKVYPRMIKNSRKLGRLDQVRLIKDGYTEVRLRKPGPKTQKQLLNVLGATEVKNNTLQPGANPNALIYEKEEVIYLLSNGNLVEIRP
ncbi:MAG TPA: M14 family metallopeptidase [Saprospiraceae bacterium]|nr:M14 family metallopeptidase [Saprospiraceae bacterium]HNT22035.1 M14 family metallopeptidase [Saprospiraceae bacterium]